MSLRESSHPALVSVGRIRKIPGATASLVQVASAPVGDGGQGQLCHVWEADNSTGRCEAAVDTTTAGAEEDSGSCYKIA